MCYGMLCKVERGFANESVDDRQHVHTALGLPIWPVLSHLLRASRRARARDMLFNGFTTR